MKSEERINPRDLNRLCAIIDGKQKATKPFLNKLAKNASKIIGVTLTSDDIEEAIRDVKEIASEQKGLSAREMILKAAEDLDKQTAKD